MENSPSNFYRAVIEKSESHQDHPQHQLWLDYALATNERGKDVVKSVLSFVPSLRDKRHLDVGCGYGGTCISFAQAGTASLGVDLDRGLLDLARANLSDHPGLNLEFRELDVMSQEAIDPLGKFDIITCDNLIEHVAVPERLIAHLRRLLNPEGVVYMTIPNAFSIGQIKKDCHYGQFGVSLLDPIDGARYVKQAIGQPTYDVSYYFPYGYYEDQFRKYGLSPILLNNYSAAEEKIAQVWESAQGLLPTEIALHQQAALPIEVSEKLSQNLRVFIRRLETDIALYYWLKGKREKQLLAGRILRDYDTELWYVVLSVRTVKLSDRIGYFTNTLEYLFKKARNRALSTYK